LNFGPKNPHLRYIRKKEKHVAGCEFKIRRGGRKASSTARRKAQGVKKQKQGAESREQRQLKVKIEKCKVQNEK